MVPRSTKIPFDPEREIERSKYGRRGGGGEKAMVVIFLAVNGERVLYFPVCGVEREGGI